MNANSTGTVGVDVPTDSELPGWIWLVFPPMAFPLAAALWLRAHWAEIPERFPMHYGTNGPDSWAARTPLHVFAPLIFAEGLVLVMVGVGLVTYYGSRRSPRRAFGPEAIFLAVMYLMSVIFTFVGLLPVTHFPPWILAALIVPVAIGLIAWMAIRNAAPDDTPDDTPKECWTAFGTGEMYSNPQDPALFVPQRTGSGYALNFGNRWAKVFLAGTIGAVGALVGFLIWALR